ncbi:MFS transporter [Actinoplanes sp. G11-F43]|uniref:MFS transporter n=1 Tax=Actinoplanes sp. G11-F43 TaxID=3424130 RepID=UPI003D34C335
MSQSTAPKTPVPDDTVAPATNSLVAVLRDRTMRAPLLWSVIGRFPIYMVGLALVISTASRGSGYISAGLLLAGYTLGVALVAPFVARRVDRYGQPPVLLITGVVYPVALVGFVYADQASLPVQLVLVVVAGAMNPPLSGCIRSLWSTAGGHLEQAGLSIEAVLSEVFTIGGPLLLSVVLFWGDEGTALIVGGLLAGVGAIGFATSRASRETQVAHAGQDSVEERDRLGALRSPILARMLIVLFGCGLATGIYNVAVPAFAEAHGSAQDIGLIFGIWGVGGIIGGVWYSTHTLRRPPVIAFATGSLIMAACAALVMLAWDNWSIGAALVLLGAVTAPVTAISYQLVSRAARAGYITEAFTWAMTVILGGSAIGSQLGGLIIEATGTRVAFLAVVVVMLSVAAGVYAIRHRFTAAPATEPAV